MKVKRIQKIDRLSDLTRINAESLLDKKSLAKISGSWVDAGEIVDIEKSEIEKMFDDIVFIRTESNEWTEGCKLILNVKDKGSFIKYWRY
ncbi:hypothetical protein [Methanococcus voltae]|uniref:Uncharacterized protein n=2 Tax=Methanococcus voltae TaxID=2188 RepID=A0A8J7RFZ7_METVO|nr:hypothetical protein [Methanococcus voltae]MBP2171918.1 hypothetical protein [Methanococcus voltae]MBP2201127.1 hypothetical protein [Methanococcus voltae]MCS3921850.1 hypothetical protein [Methanococcus voltae PS]